MFKRFHNDQMRCSLHIEMWSNFGSVFDHFHSVIGEVLFCHRRGAKHLSQQIQDHLGSTWPLGWMNIQNHINFRKAVMVFKSPNNLAPQYMTNMLNYVPNTVNTR